MVDPMYNKLEFFQLEKYEIKENDEYIYDLNLIRYLDLNDNIICQNLIYYNRYLNNKINKKNKKISYFIEECNINKEGDLIMKKNTDSGKKLINKNYFGIALSVLPIGLKFPFGIAISITLLGGAFILNKINKEKRETTKINEQIKNKKIDEDIKELLSNRYIEKDNNSEINKKLQDDWVIIEK